jgi:hypothetical protein
MYLKKKVLIKLNGTVDIQKIVTIILPFVSIIQLTCLISAHFFAALYFSFMEIRKVSLNLARRILFYTNWQAI